MSNSSSSASSTEASLNALLRERIEMVLKAGELESFAAEQARTCKLTQVNVKGITLINTNGEDEPETKAGRGSTAATVIETVVEPSCCNLSGNAHGGYLAWLVDHCSSTPIFCLWSNSAEGESRWVTSGVSTNINMYYISAAPVGTRLRVTSTILQLGRNTATVDVRVTDAESGRLVVQATHVKQDVTRPTTDVAEKLGAKPKGAKGSKSQSRSKSKL